MTKANFQAIDASGKNFNQTEDECAQEGGHLTSIHNEAENTFVLALIYGSNAWIGLYFDGLIGNWTDGTPNDYNNFFGSPSVFNKCTYLVGQHGIPDLYRFWVIDDCTKSEGLAVCKKSPA
uniref:C-type lectin domain-containing protein n=1 Tax=Acrobeloides nanus TaxID=290746 RepID=A0A914DTP0_9BILA